MIKNNSSFIFLFVFLISLNQLIYSQQLIEPDYSCADKLLNKIGINLSIGSNGYKDFCASGRFSCNTNGTVYYVNLSSSNGSYVGYNDLSCFNYLSNLDFTNINLMEDIAGTPPERGITSFKINFYGCYNQYATLPFAPPTQQVHFLNLVENFKANITFSSMKYLNTFEMYEWGSPYKSFMFPYITNDLTETIPLTLTFLYVSNIPSFKYSNPSTIEITLGWGFDKTSISNFNDLSYLTKNPYISLKVLDGSIPFPFKKISSSSIVLNSYLDKPTDFIDLGEVKTTNLALSNVSSSFSINGQIPFKNFSSSIQTLTISNGVFTSIPKITPPSLNLKCNLTGSVLGKYSDYSNLKTLYVSNNGLTGTIDESWCGIQALDFSSNQFIDPLPKCFSCFFLSSTTALTSKFQSNNFSSLLPPNDCKIIPNLYVDSKAKGLYLSGNYIGLAFYKPFVSSITFSWINYTLYYASYSASNLPDLIYVNYTGGSNFTLFTSNTSPKISRVSPSSDNSNVFIFDGSYFKYNISITKIKIGDQNCNIIDTTFNQINCSVDNAFNIDSKDLITYITVDGLTTQITVTPTIVNNIIPCDGSCGSNICYTSVGQCIVTQYVSSIIPIQSNSQGTVQIFGLFGIFNQNLSVTIGGIDCNVTYIDNNQINCTLNGENQSGFQLLNITQNGITYLNKNLFSYIQSIQLCPNNCFANQTQGSCNTTIGLCNCNDQFIGIDCSIKKQSNENQSPNQPQINNTVVVNSDTASTSISNQQTSFVIRYLSLLEIDIYGNMVRNHSLQEQWTNDNNDNNTSNQFIFSQFLNDSNCEIISIIEQVQQDKMFTFAGVDFKMDSGSLKLTISINNYTYQSNLNTLQLLFESLVEQSNDGNYNNQCNNQETSIDTSLISSDTILNYITIESNNKLLQGRFINRVVSDGKPTALKTTIVSKNQQSLIVSLDLPHCNQQCIIDPDFSVLLSNNYIDDCSSSNKRKWLLPVAVVIPVVGLCCIVIVSVLIYKRYKTSIRIKLLKFNSIKLSKK